jgi:hypothetical protein
VHPLARPLGLAGLIPFLVCALGVWFAPPGWRGTSLIALLVYGAVILSFLGAVHWGLALAQPGHTRNGQRLVLGVLPALIGWTSVLTVPRYGLGLLVAGFGLVFLAERAAVADGALPQDYFALRRVLTLGAVLALAAGAAGIIAR